MAGKSKRGLSKRGLSPKGANWAKKGPFGAISTPPPWLWGAEELGLISPEKALIGAEKAPICPEKARFPRKDFPPIFSENLGLKPPFVSPRLDFPKNGCKLLLAPELGLLCMPEHGITGPFVCLPLFEDYLCIAKDSVLGVQTSERGILGVGKEKW